MHKYLLGTLVIVTSLAFAVSAEAKVWKGKWGGQSSSTLQFLDGNRVQYCFKSECHIAKYTGNKNGTIFFRWGNSRFKFEKTSDGLVGGYRAGTNTSTILMK